MVGLLVASEPAVMMSAPDVGGVAGAWYVSLTTPTPSVPSLVGTLVRTWPWEEAVPPPVVGLKERKTSVLARPAPLESVAVTVNVTAAEAAKLAGEAIGDGLKVSAAKGFGAAADAGATAPTAPETRAVIASKAILAARPRPERCWRDASTLECSD